jgi:murein DD-endopeptidase MepM/ murein hydrolase activator NlpD
MLVLAPLAAVLSLVVPAATNEGSHMGGGPIPAQVVECIPPAERAAAEKRVAQFQAANPTRARRARSGQLYSFVPQGGNLWDDLSVNNYVDMDTTTPGIKDWNCTDWTYDGHQGWDIDLRTFAYADIGVPIFAAVDGTVADAHDGEWDHETSKVSGALANYVILYHGGTQYTWYWHMRRGSVAVSTGQPVKAGQQIGLTGSSGFSTGPHLHFESRDNGTYFEPAAGTCNPGASNWVTQPIKPTAMYLRDAAVTDAFMDNYPGLPWDQPRTGTIVQNVAGSSHNVALWIELGCMPANSTWSIRYLRPNGTAVITSGPNAFNNPFYRESWWWFRYFVNLDTSGVWKVELSINGKVLVSAPFTVVSNVQQVVNQPPSGITLAFDPPSPKPSDVLFCRITSPPVPGDPDYDVVRYHYVWTVNGQTVRDVVSAGRADAIPHDSGVAGNTVQCTVTPSDGQLSGPSSFVQAFLGSALIGDVDGNGAVEMQDALLAIRIAGGTTPSDAGEVSRTQPLAGNAIQLPDATRIFRRVLGL